MTCDIFSIDQWSKNSRKQKKELKEFFVFTRGLIEEIFISKQKEHHPITLSFMHSDECQIVRI
jgi:hypothetical protein